MIEDAKIRPIANGYIVSCYKLPEATESQPIPRGDYYEEFYVSHEDAGKRLAELVKRTSDADKMYEFTDDEKANAMMRQAPPSTTKL